MVDEEKHGLGFPKGIEQLVDEVLKELGGSVPLNKDRASTHVERSSQPADGKN